MAQLKPISASTRPPDSLFKSLSKFASQPSRANFLNHHEELIRPEVVMQLAQVIVETIRKDTRKAMRLAESGVLIARRLHDRECTATAWRAKANALYGIGDNRAAVNFHRRAIKIFLSLGKRKEAARALSGSIQPHILIGEYDDAVAASKEARAIYLKLGENWRLARLEINTGNIFHRQDRFEEALKCYERAYQGLLHHQDAEGLGVVLGNIAVCLVSLNDFDRALKTYEQARAVCEQNAMPLLVAQSDYNIAYLYYLRGDYSQAIERLFASKQAFQTSGDQYHVALCQLDLSEIYLELNLNEDAEVMAREGFHHFRKLKAGYEAAKSLVNRAIALSRQGKASETLKIFRDASRRFLAEKNKIWPKMIELYRGVVLFHEGRYSEARRDCAGTATFFDTVRMPGKAALAHLLLARIAFQSDDLIAAAFHTGHALARLNRPNSPELGFQAHFLRGQIAGARGDARGAYSAYQEARHHLESLRSRLSREELKIAFMKNRLEVYEKLVGLCLRDGISQGGQKEAFDYIEAAKSRNMAEIISKGRSRTLTPDDKCPEITRTLNRLRQDLNWYYHRIEIGQFGAEAVSEDALDRLRKKAARLEKEFERTLRELPHSLEEAAIADGPVSHQLEEIQETLGGTSTLLEYFSLGDHLVVAVLTARDVHIVRLAPLKYLQDLLFQLQFQLGKFRFGKSDLFQIAGALLPAIQSSLSTLYDQLIAPVRPFLHTDHLIVAPHGVLHYLPFHALRVGDEYLCDLMCLSYAPSATVFFQCQRMQAKAIESSLIMGIPDELAPLIESEVRSIAEIVPGPKVFIGPQATAKVLREEGLKSGLVHISTHGTFRRDNPMFSSIRLGDGPLNLHDLYQMRLDSTLVSLSGCSTGMNMVVPGDELLGLQRGLLYGGARSMLLSLWDVNDQTTAELMTAFYRRSMEGNQPPLALQGAMREIRSRYPHPYYWAPFIFVGKHTIEDSIAS